MLDIWWNALEQLEFDSVKKALEAHVLHPDKGQYMPKPADVMEQLSELPFRAREFEKRYQSLWNHPPLECPHQLAGLLEQQNRLGGYVPPPPVLIGQNSTATKLETL